jgi:hypothetical protein
MPDKQAYDGYQFYQQQIKACDRQLQESMEKLNNFHQDEKSKKMISFTKDRKPIMQNKADVNHLGGHLLKIFSGTDATQLPGVTDYIWLQLYSKVGKELSNWSTEKHFISWLGLAPGQHQSGKKNKSRSKKHRPKAG